MRKLILLTLLIASPAFADCKVVENSIKAETDISDIEVSCKKGYLSNFTCSYADDGESGGVAESEIKTNKTGVCHFFTYNGEIDDETGEVIEPYTNVLVTKALCCR